jgi:hypothetical protein
MSELLSQYQAGILLTCSILRDLVPPVKTGYDEQIVCAGACILSQLRPEDSKMGEKLPRLNTIFPLKVVAMVSSDVDKEDRRKIG